MQHRSFATAPIDSNMALSRFQWRPLISDELFHRHSFLEFYTFDGGGCFINRALLGTVDSFEITKLIKLDILENYIL